MFAESKKYIQIIACNLLELFRFALQCGTAFPESVYKHFHIGRKPCRVCNSYAQDLSCGNILIRNSNCLPNDLYISRKGCKLNRCCGCKKIRVANTADLYNAALGSESDNGRIPFRADSGYYCGYIHICSVWLPIQKGNERN